MRGGEEKVGQTVLTLFLFVLGLLWINLTLSMRIVKRRNQSV